jgi:hypothetical protein
MHQAPHRRQYRPSMSTRLLGCTVLTPASQPRSRPRFSPTDCTPPPGPVLAAGAAPALSRSICIVVLFLQVVCCHLCVRHRSLAVSRLANVQGLPHSALHTNLTSSFTLVRKHDWKRQYGNRGRRAPRCAPCSASEHPRWHWQCR